MRTLRKATAAAAAAVALAALATGPALAHDTEIPAVNYDLNSCVYSINANNIFLRLSPNGTAFGITHENDTVISAPNTVSANEGGQTWVYVWDNSVAPTDAYSGWVGSKYMTLDSCLDPSQEAAGDTAGAGHAARGAVVPAVNYDLEMCLYHITSGNISYRASPDGKVLGSAVKGSQVASAPRTFSGTVGGQTWGYVDTLGWVGWVGHSYMTSFSCKKPSQEAG